MIMSTRPCIHRICTQRFTPVVWYYLFCDICEAGSPRKYEKYKSLYDVFQFSRYSWVKSVLGVEFRRLGGRSVTDRNWLNRYCCPLLAVKTSLTHSVHLLSFCSYSRKIVFTGLKVRPEEKTVSFKKINPNILFVFKWHLISISNRFGMVCSFDTASLFMRHLISVVVDATDLEWRPMIP